MDEFVPLVRKARERGWHTIVCDGYPNTPAKLIADESYDVDPRDADAVARLCAEVCADGIVSSYSDLLAECCANIAQRAGLGCPLPPDRLAYLRDKSLMKGMFDELGIPYPKTARVRRGHVREDLEGMGFPCVTKPADAWGSHGVRVLGDAREVEAAYDEVAGYSDAPYIFVEEYDDGLEFNLMSWVVDGRPVVLEVADREKSDDGEATVPWVSRIVYPSAHTDDVLGEATEMLQKVAGYVGLLNGPLCMQFFWAPGRGVRVCECAGRIFGYEHELLEYASAGAVCVEDLLLDNVYDPIAVSSRLEGHDPHLADVAAGLYFHGRDGRVASVGGLPDESDPLVKETIVYYRPGEIISHQVGDKPYAARVYLCSPDRGELDRRTDELFQSASMTDGQGRELLLRNRRKSPEGTA